MASDFLSVWISAPGAYDPHTGLIVGNPDVSLTWHDEGIPTLLEDGKITVNARTRKPRRIQIASSLPFELCFLSPDETLEGVTKWRTDEAGEEILMSGGVVIFEALMPGGAGLLFARTTITEDSNSEFA